ncbi:MAG: hypothetical protein IPL35_07285 [Sphingobacteriales bacterium]|nr:hypothetical protein [Sphingobacteriales bacterium]
MNVLKITGLAIFIKMMMMSAACESSIGSSSKDATAPPLYFDVPAYMRAQTREWQQQNAVLEKTVHIDTTQEIQIFEQPDWERELELWLRCDLNKAAWRGLFSTDSSSSSGGTTVVTYSNSNIAEIPHKKVQIVFDAQHRPLSLKIENSHESFLASGSEKLQYDALQKYYTYEVIQQLKGIEQSSFLIEGKIKTP